MLLIGSYQSLPRLLLRGVPAHQQSAAHALPVRWLGAPPGSNDLQR
jgi:hypothetical protein